MLKHKTTGAIVQAVSVNWNPSNGDWLIDGKTTLADPKQNYEWVDNPPTVSTIKFLMLFTPAERIAARSLRATDAGIDDFWRLLDDTRTTEVNMSLPSVQSAIEYTLTAIKVVAPKTNVASRKTEILTGILV